MPPRRNDKDVGSNPAATRSTEGGRMVWTGSQWKTSCVKPN